MLARTVQGLLLMGTRLFQQSNRNVLGLMLVFMAEDMQIGTAERGTLLSAIAAGYLFTQIPGGALADKLGAKFVMTVALFLSGAMCLIVPMVADRFGINGLWLTIVCMGAVQGPLFPTSSVYLSRWLPKKSATSGDEKAWGTAMLDIGISVGSLLIIPVANSLGEAFGWRATYQIIGGATIAFVGLWQVLAAETPRACWYITKEELTFLEKHVAAPKGSAPATAAAAAKEAKSPARSDGDRLGKLLGMPSRVALHPGVWAVFVAHIAFNFGAYYMTNWNPTYYKEVLGVSTADAKYHLMMPHVTNLLAKSANPALVRIVEERNISLLGSRRLFTASGFVLAALALLPVARLSSFNPWVSTAFFSLANMFFGLAPSGFKANYLDITEEYVGIISGYGNTLGTVASWAGPKLVAALLLHFGSWDIVLLVVASSNIFASLNYWRNSTVEVVERVAGSKKA